MVQDRETRVNSYMDLRPVDDMPLFAHKVWTTRLQFNNNLIFPLSGNEVKNANPADQRHITNNDSLYEFNSSSWVFEATINCSHDKWTAPML